MTSPSTSFIALLNLGRGRLNGLVFKVFGLNRFCCTEMCEDEKSLSSPVRLLQRARQCHLSELSLIYIWMRKKESICVVSTGEGPACPARNSSVLS